MKLISKTILYYLLISLPLLLIAGVFSYFLIKSELHEGTDELLVRDKINAQKLIDTFKEPTILFLDADSLSSVRPVTSALSGDVFSDTSIYDKTENEFIVYRMLKSYYPSKGATYLITVSKTTIEENELLEGLLSSFAIIAGFLVFAFFIVNWLLSKTLWKPFYKTLSQLNNYDIKKHAQSHFENARITEFEQLNATLNKMTEKIHSDFAKQKEFTENASHEMQTPLAVVKANLSLLMQSPNLKEEEMDRLQAIDNTLKKLNALNKALILLTKIENNQFTENTTVHLKDTVAKALANFSDLVEAKKIRVETTFSDDLCINMDPALADILISNLLQNAIRHNYEGGRIVVSINEKTLTIANIGEPLRISEEEMFTRFKKNDASKDSLGIGLSIVKSICTLYAVGISYRYTDSLHTFTLKP